MNESPFRHFNGMRWPAPCDRLGDLEWRLRHFPDSITGSDRMVAASVIQAYQYLIGLPVRDRDAVIRELRKGPGIVRDISPKSDARDPGAQS